MHSYSVTTGLSCAAWDAFVDSCPAATPYHRYAWKGVVEESFGHGCHYLAAVDRDGVVAGVLPLVHMKSALFGNFLVSLPFFNFGGVLCRCSEAGEALTAAAEKLRREQGAQHVELRHMGAALEGLPTRQHKVTMVLPLAADQEAQWGAFNAKLRNQVRKAEKSGLTAVVGHLELLDDFYRVFARNMRDLGTPVYGKEFFESVLRTYPQSTWIIAVRHGGVAVAAGIASRFRDGMEMPWASSVADYKPLCPNNLLYWEAIRFAIGQGCTSFDFGRSTPNEGTYNFKKQWGALPVQLYWQYLLEEGKPLPELDPHNPKYALAIRLWKRLPVGVSKLLGPPLVRNIP